MDLQRTADIESRFVAYVDGLAGVIGHGDRERPLRDYCTGLVMPCERKSVEPMAAVTAPARVGAQHQSLLHFVGEAPWSDENVLAKVREMVLPAIERHGRLSHDAGVILRRWHHAEYLGVGARQGAAATEELVRSGAATEADPP